MVTHPIPSCPSPAPGGWWRPERSWSVSTRSTSMTPAAAHGCALDAPRGGNPYRGTPHGPSLTAAYAVPLHRSSPGQHPLSGPSGWPRSADAAASMLPKVRIRGFAAIEAPISYHSRSTGLGLGDGATLDVYGSRPGICGLAFIAWITSPVEVLDPLMYDEIGHDSRSAPVLAMRTADPARWCPRLPGHRCRRRPRPIRRPIRLHPLQVRPIPSG